MSDRASSWSATGWGLATGILGTITVWIVGQTFRVCGPMQFGPYPDAVQTWPSDPMTVEPTILTPGYYCTSALGGDLTALAPWILGVVVGLICLGIGALVDRQRDARSVAPPTA